MSQPRKPSNFVQRAVTGLCLVAAIIGCVFWSPYAFAGLFGVLIFAVLFEFYTLINVTREVHISRALHSLAGVLLFACSFLETSKLTGNNIFLAYLTYMLALFISLLYSKQQNPIRELSYILLGQIYIAAPLSMLNSVAFHMIKYPGDSMIMNYCPIFLLSLFFFIWINDTGAYLTGMSLGKVRIGRTQLGQYKLFERISPKKTWVGFVGGFVFCILLGVLLGDSSAFVWHWLGINLHDGVRLSRFEWTLLGIVVSIFSTFGDLIESFVKRSVGVKDSGHILPGHGGFWDRFDSLILAAPAMYIFLVIIAALH